MIYLELHITYLKKMEVIMLEVLKIHGFIDPKWQKRWAHHDALFAVEQTKIGIFLDKHFTGRLESGGMYANIMRACPKLRLKKYKNRMAVEVLKGRPYKGRFYYYYYRIYNK